MASCTKDAFKEMEESIETTFNELITILKSRKSNLLKQLKKMKSEYLEKERVRLEQLQDLDKLIGQLDGTETKHTQSKKLQSDFVSNANREKDKFLLPTPVAIQEFVYQSLDNVKGILAEFGKIIEAPYTTKDIPKVTFGRKGVKPGYLSVPLGLSCNDDHIFVVDMINHRIQAFTMDGAYEFKLGWQQLTKPHGLFVDSPAIYVTDSDQNTLYKFHCNGSQSFIVCCSGENILDTPLGVSADTKECVYVADSSNNRVAVFDATNLAHLREIGVGKLKNPRDVSIHADNVYVIDYSVPFHVHEFELDGTAVRSIVNLKGGTGTLFFCIDTANNIIVNDGASSCMQIFNKTGLLIHSISVKSPGGVAVTEDGDLICVRKYDREQIAIY